MLKSLTTRLILTASWLITAARGIWLACEPVDKQRIYFANHNSHGDFTLIWSVLPRALRRRTRPVAGADYWLACIGAGLTALRRASRIRRSLLKR